MSVNSGTIKKLIARRHPEYESMKIHWDFMDACYRGGRKWFEENIFEYHKEGAQEFSNRKKRAFRFNHTREIVDLTNKYLFRAEISRKDGAPNAVKEFWGNVNRDGLNIKDFMQVVSQKNSTLGCPWIIVDNAETNVPPNQSKADEKKGGIYAYVIPPQRVLDWSWNSEDGLLNWILIEEAYRNDQDPFNSDTETKYRHRLWTRTNWYLYRATDKSGIYEQEDTGINSIGVVPAIRADHLISSDPWSTPALIADVAYLDRAVANYLSNLDAIIQDQTFSQLAIPAQGLLPGEDGHKKILEMGTKRIFTYDGEGGGKPFFLSPDPRQATLIVAVIQQIINEIYHSVGLAGERTKQDNAKGIDNSSGVAKSKDFERVNSLLSSKAMSLQVIENKIAYLVALYAGEENQWDWSEELVVYPKTFDVRQLQDEFDIAMRLSLIEVPEIIRAEQMKAVVEKLFPNLSGELKERMMKEVKSWEERLREQASFNMTSSSETGGSIVEEAKRERLASGQKQSDTKSRQENGNS